MNDFFLVSGHNPLLVLVGIIGCVLLGVISIYLSTYVFGYMEHKRLQEKKKVQKQRIADLIEMKEIQGELEIEMREALLRKGLLEKDSKEK